MNSVDVIIPVYKPDERLDILLAMLNTQTMKPDRVILLWTIPEGEEFSALKALDFKTVAMALRNDTRVISDPEIKSAERLAIFLGAEGDGLLPETIAACDWCVKIPMDHEVDSLNVAACSAVAFWELSK